MCCVLTGAMSLVGPRPLPDYHLRVLHSEFMELRGGVWPGVAGFWQIMVRSDGRLDAHQRYDAYYIRNWSVWLDFYILARILFSVQGAC